MRTQSIVVMVVGVVAGCGVDDAVDDPVGGDDGVGTIEQDLTGPAPDYVVSALTAPPAAALTGDSFAVTVTIANVGTAAATVESRTKYGLSTDLALGSDKWLTATTAVPPLAIGATDTQAATLKIPSIAGGTYYLVACADKTLKVVESNNANNCRFASTPVVITGPDLVVSAVTEPPAALVTGQAFTVTTTVDNVGTGAAIATSRTKYGLSTDLVLGADKWFAATTLVPALAAGASDTQTRTIKVPSAAPGTYYLVACADQAANLAELDDSNNCRFATTAVTLTGADLVVSAVSEPGTQLHVGQTFPITDTVTNAGTAAAASSTTAYYLSPFPGKGTGAFKLTAKRTTGGLGVGATSTGTVTATVPAVPVGYYYVVACADSTSQVVETDDKNNCRASTGQAAIGVPGADLVVSAVSEPGTQLDVGQTFPITDTVTNAGTAAAASSTTAYYLSPFPGNGTGAFKLTAERTTGGLGVGASSTGTVTATVPAVPAGFYYVVACADSTSQVVEIDDNNNCRASTGQAAIGLPGGDMTIDAVATIDGYHQVTQGADATLVITGTGLDHATSVSLGLFSGVILSATPTELVAQISVDHGTTLGPRMLTLISPAGPTGYPGAIEVTPFIVTPGGSPTAPCTYEAPCNLGGPDFELLTGGGDRMELAAGIHQCANTIFVSNVEIVGAGEDVTFIQGDPGGGFGGFAFTGGGTTLSDLTITTTTSPYAIHTTVDHGGTAMTRVKLVGGGIRAWSELPFEPGQLTLTDSELTGAGTAILVESGSAVVTLTGTVISGCGTGVHVNKGTVTLDGVTIVACARGIQLGAFPVGQLLDVTVTNADLVDNTIGAEIDDGQLTLADITIRDDPATAAACTTGVSIANGRLVMNGGSITGQQVAGVDASDSSGESDLLATITGASIQGGAYGVRFAGFPDIQSLTMHSTTVSGQTTAAVSWDVGDGFEIDLSGNQLSVASGYALQVIATDVLWGLVHADGTTFNGHTYSGVVDGPADVAPDYRIVDGAVQIQF